MLEFLPCAQEETQNETKASKINSLLMLVSVGFKAGFRVRLHNKCDRNWHRVAYSIAPLPRTPDVGVRLDQLRTEQRVAPIIFAKTVYTKYLTLPAIQLKSGNLQPPNTIGQANELQRPDAGT